MHFPDQIINILESYFDSQPATPNDTIECSEHALIKHCQREGIEPITQLDISRSLELFQAHFLIRHALYQIQQRYLKTRRYVLNIELTRITRSPWTQSTELQLAFGDQSLRFYYLDLNNLFNTNEHQVNTLLKDFWQRYLASDGKLNALKTLGLDLGATYFEAKAAYRALAQKNHPDKGGDKESFTRITEAMGILEQCLKQERPSI